MSTTSPAQMGGGARPPPHFGAEKPKWGGGGQKVQKCSKESTFDVFCTEFSLNWDRKSQFFRALRARSIIHSLQLGSHPRLGPKVACFTTTCAQKCLKRIKKRTKATQNDKNVHTPLKTTFFTVYRKIFFGGRPPPPQVFQMGGGGAPPAFRRTRYKTLVSSDITLQWTVL